MRLESKPAAAPASVVNDVTNTQSESTVTRSASKRSVSTSSLRAASSSAGKAQSGASMTRQTSATGKALFTGRHALANCSYSWAIPSSI